MDLRIVSFRKVLFFAITLGLFSMGCKEAPTTAAAPKEQPVVKTTPKADPTPVAVATPVSAPVKAAEPCGTVEISELEVISGPGKKHLKTTGRVLKRHEKSFEYCYKRGLAENPDLAGEVVLRFEIAGTGGVTLARMTENTMGPTAGTCMLTSVKRIVFPSSTGKPAVIEQRIKGIPCTK